MTQFNSDSPESVIVVYFCIWATLFCLSTEFVIKNRCIQYCICIIYKNEFDVCALIAMRNQRTVEVNDFLNYVCIFIL